MILPLNPLDSPARTWLAPALAGLLFCCGWALFSQLAAPAGAEFALRYLVLNPRCEWPAAGAHLAAPASWSAWLLGALALWSLGGALEREGRALLVSVCALSAGAAALAAVGLSGQWRGPCGLVAGVAGAALALRPRGRLRFALWLPLLLSPLPVVGGALALVAWLYCWFSLRRESPPEGFLLRAIGWLSVSAPTWLVATSALLASLLCAETPAGPVAGAAAGLGLGLLWARGASRRAGARRPAAAPFARTEQLALRRRPSSQRTLESFGSWRRARAARRG